MATREAIIVFAIVIGGPIILGITFYFIDELFKADKKYKDEMDFLKRLKCNEKQRSDPAEKPNWQQKFGGQ